MLLMTGGSVTLAHTVQAATTPSPSTISQDPFLVPTLRADPAHLLKHSLPSLPRLLCAPESNYHFLLSLGKNPSVSSAPRFASSLCPPCGSGRPTHREPGRGGLGQPVLPRYGVFRCCKAAGSPQPLQTLFPILAEAQFEAVGPVMGRTGPRELGKGVPGLGQDHPKLPLIQGTVPIPSCNSTPCLPHGWKPNPAQFGASLAAGLAVG